MTRPIRTLVTISTDKFEAAHGKKPRGGYALWAFAVSGSATQRPTEFWANGSWSQAKAQAAQFCREEGYAHAELLA